MVEETTTTTEKTKKRKWLGRIGHFLMYGGWILLLAVGLGVYIAISMLTQAS
jgi:hypothetical protein